MAQLPLFRQVEALAEGGRVAVAVPGSHYRLGAILRRVLEDHCTNGLTRLPFVRKGLIRLPFHPFDRVLDGGRALAPGTELEEERAVHGHRHVRPGALEPHDLL